MIALPGDKNPRTMVPPLREDLQLFSGAATAEGTPTWVVHDWVRDRYFQIERTGMELLMRWQDGDADRIRQRVNAETTCTVTADDVTRFIRFLVTHELVQGDCQPAVWWRDTVEARRRKTDWNRLVGALLFFRFPLFRTDRFLARTLPLVAPLYSRTAWRLVAASGLLGLLLVFRQWPAFQATFLHFFTWSGALLFMATLSAVKLCHELGHAYTAKRFGCRVPVIGVALIFLWPVFYTDTTDTWRLRSRHQRMAVAAAGVITELGLAAVSTLLWSFLPEGSGRSLCFFVATVSWITTLAVNLVPFFRFDGYYLLSDFLGIQNLEPRANALGRWQLRHLVLGVHQPPPEALSPRLRHILILFSFGSWIYRTLVFLGFALIIYHFFIKLIGVALFLFQVVFYMIKPIYMEIREWVRRRDQIRPNLQLGLSLCGLAALIWFSVTPWSTWSRAPAVHRAASYAGVFAPAPGRVVEVGLVRGRRVGAGETLVRLTSPALEHDIVTARHQIGMLRQLLARQAGSLEQLRDSDVLRTQLAGAIARLRSAEALSRLLTITAPLSGVVADVPAGLEPGRWVNETDRLALIVGQDQDQIAAYVTEADLPRLAPGLRATFYPDNPFDASVDAVVAAVGDANLIDLDEPALGSDFGGPVAVRRDQDGRLIPEQSIYRVILEPVGPRTVPQLTRGVARIEGIASAPLDQLWRFAAAVVIRETGF